MAFSFIQTTFYKCVRAPYSLKVVALTVMTFCLLMIYPSYWLFAMKGIVARPKDQVDDYRD
jgi:hypothetical protein